MYAALVDQAKRGDREAFDSLARLTGDRCMAIAFRILRDFDLADDAVQSALLTAWRELRALRDPERFEPWLHRILTNACYAEARRRRRWSEGIRLLPAPGHPPGQVAVEIGGVALYLADAVIDEQHVEHPEWSFKFDEDQNVAAETRKAMFELAAGEEEESADPVEKGDGECYLLSII